MPCEPNLCIHRRYAPATNYSFLNHLKVGSIDRLGHYFRIGTRSGMQICSGTNTTTFAAHIPAGQDSGHAEIHAIALKFSLMENLAILNISQHY